ncbi:MAG: ATP-binding protein, partial [Cyanobacteria bacterium P01_A01_bin.105]
CCHSGQPFVYEEHLQFQGQDTWWLTTLNPLQNASGEIYRLVGTTIDITRRCEAEQALRHQATELQKALDQLRLAQSQLVQSEKMSSLGQLVAGIAHEVNNPISFIFGNIVHAQDYIEDLVGLIRLYRRTYPQATPAIETHIQEMDLDYTITDLSNLLGSMMTGAKRIHTIMQSLRDFSRLDEVGQKPTDLHHGIDSTLMVLQNRLHGTTHRSDIKVVKNYGEIPPVVCYPRQLNQVFLNVLTNAIDALDGHYHRSRSRADAADLNIQIQTRAVDAGRVQVSIRDSGPGISAEHCAIVFDPFFTTKAVGHGTGMGLAIAYQIVVQQHGGQMTARVPEEGGTEISLEIPIQSQ